MLQPESSGLIFCSTHGASRPFLPAMIRKNNATAVSEASAAAAKTLSSLKHDSSLSQALEVTLSAMTAVSRLSGVGPATASLVLAVYKPDLVPFFQDELWAWCLPEKAGTKLKYDKKEYETLFRKSWELRARLGPRTDMVKLEKASFVLQHVDLLPEDENALRLGLESKEESTEADAGPTVLDKKTRPVERELAKTHTKRTATGGHYASDFSNKDGAPRRSKRAKKDA